MLVIPVLQLRTACQSLLNLCSDLNVVQHIRRSYEVATAIAVRRAFPLVLKGPAALADYPPCLLTVVLVDLIDQILQFSQHDVAVQDSKSAGFVR
ncbi:MAG: hypothetical protein JW384_02031 [Nitrosomonadaceae bacterium]|nr:hypothetical protein [Nitrosomonadaceae bacterium]